MLTFSFSCSLVVLLYAFLYCLCFLFCLIVFCSASFIFFLGLFFFFSSRRRHTRCALVTGVQTCALPIWPNLSPFNAWVVLKGLETLDLRARRQSDNALAVGKAIEGRVARMLHPGLPSHPQHELAMRQMDACGPIFAFELPGGTEQAMAFLNALDLQIGRAHV